MLNCSVRTDITNKLELEKLYCRCFSKLLILTKTLVSYIDRALKELFRLSYLCTFLLVASSTFLFNGSSRMVYNPAKSLRLTMNLDGSSTLPLINNNVF